MARWIRWQGLGVFGVVVALFCIFWFLSIDGIVESMVEKYGTKAVGAKVELESADLSLFPAGLELRGLKVTNPDQPMRNVVEIDSIRLSFDAPNFFRRKLIVDQMNLEGVKLNTPRRTSGALPEVSKKHKAIGTDARAKKRTSICQGRKLPSLAMPDISEILKKEKLNSVELVTSLRLQIDNEKQTWQQRLSSLPDQKTFQSYKNQIDQLRRGGSGIAGMLTSGGKALELKKKIEADIRRIKQAKAEFQKEMTALKRGMAQARKAPFEDASRLAKKYGLSKEGLSNLSHLLFGAKVCGWMEKTVNWYHRIRPILERTKQKKKGREIVKPLRGKGLYVKFKEHHPIPDFLIKEAKTSIITGAGIIGGVIRNITPDQDILGLPLTFNFRGEKLKAVKLLEASGFLNHIKPQAPKDEIKLLVKGFQARGIAIMDRAKTPILLEKALADLNLKALLKGQKINGNMLAAFHSASFSVKAASEANPIMDAIFSALRNVSDFIVNAKVTGTLTDYNIHVSSDLDGVLKKSVGKIIARETEELRQKLTKAIMARVNGPLGEAEDSLLQLGGVGNELAQRLSLGSKLLDSIGKTGGQKGFKLPFS